MPLREYNDIVPIEFSGGCITRLPTGLLKTGQFSNIQNMRLRHPGMEKRKGQYKLNTTADGTNKVLTLYQYKKADVTEQRFFAQMSDGDVLEATSIPPTQVSGEFGSDAFSGTESGQIPASWSMLDDMLIYSNGSDQHRIFMGDDVPVDAFIIYKSTSEDVPEIPANGFDYTQEVRSTNRGNAILDSLCAATDLVKSGTYKWTASGSGTNEYYMEASAGGDPSYSEPVRVLINGAKADRGTVGSLAAGEWDYDDNDTLGYDTVYVRLSDGTDPDTKSDGYIKGMAAAHSVFIMTKTPKIDGIKWTVASGKGNGNVAAPILYKHNGSWTAVAVSTDGTVDTATSTKTLNKTGTMSFTAPTDVIEKYMFGQNGFWWRFDFTDGLDSEVEIETVTYNTDWCEIHNVWDGVLVNAVEVQWYESTEGVYYVFGSTSVEIDSMDGSDALYVASADPIVGIYVDVGTTPNTGDCQAIDAAYYWDGDSWVSVSGLNDGTVGLAKSGFVSFARQIAVQKTQFNNSGYYAYWYKFEIDAALNDDVIVAIQTMPYYDIDDFGISYCSSPWKNRMVYSFNEYPEYIYISNEGLPLVLNGSNFGILSAGDGRNNKIAAMVPFYNELLVYQKEQGIEGGTITLFQGYNPATWGRLILSTNVGAMNAKSVVVVDGIMVSTATDQKLKTLAFSLSRYGVFVCDGTNVYKVSRDIENYFDPKESECIKRGCENEMWLAYDSSENIIRIGLVSGTTATVPNVFPVLDLDTWSWSFDSLGSELSCMAEVQAEADMPDGKKNTVIQVGGGTDDGTVYLLNYGTNDVSTAIDGYAEVVLNESGRMLNLRELILRCGVQAAGNITVTVEKNGVSELTKILAMTAALAGDEVRRHREGLSVDKDFMTIKFRNNTVSQSMFLYDSALKLSVWDDR